MFQLVQSALASDEPPNGYRAVRFEVLDSPRLESETSAVEQAPISATAAASAAADAPTRPPPRSAMRAARAAREARSFDANSDERFPERDMSWKITASCCVFSFFIIALTAAIITNNGDSRSVAQTQDAIDRHQYIPIATPLPRDYIYTHPTPTPPLIVNGTVAPPIARPPPGRVQPLARALQPAPRLAAV